MDTKFLSDNKYLIGGGLVVIGIAAYFLLKDDKKTPDYGHALMPGVDLVDISKGGKVAGLMLSMNGSTNSISTLIHQIRTRELNSGVV